MACRTIVSSSTGTKRLIRRGAGGSPTASAVLGDLVAVCRNRLAGSRGVGESAYADLRVRPATFLAYHFGGQPFELDLRIEPSPPLVRFDGRTTIGLEGSVSVRPRSPSSLAPSRKRSGSCPAGQHMSSEVRPSTPPITSRVAGFETSTASGKRRPKKIVARSVTNWTAASAGTGGGGGGGGGAVTPWPPQARTSQSPHDEASLSERLKTTP